MVNAWDGVAGTERTSFLLSLEDDATEHREALMRMAATLRRTCLVGNAAPIVQTVWDRVSVPKVGDLVVECSRAVYRLDYQGFGILLAHRFEEDSCDDVWYVQYGNSAKDVARWQNCQFMTLPVRE
jgi:hypothetical protein